MRLTKRDEAIATDELLQILADVYPSWLRTSQLRGTLPFHDSRTLALSQIIQLLRATGRVEERWENQRFSYLNGEFETLRPP
jgi:hypothetical protein